MSPNRRALIAAGASAAVGLAVLVGASLSGGDAPVVGAVPRNPAAASSSPSVFATPSPTPVPLTAESFEGKDPFQPLVQATQTSGATSTSTSTSTPTPGAPAVPTSSGQARRLTLMDIFTGDSDPVATVRVNGSEYSVAAGETFADNFKLLSLTSRCGTFVFGDERFTLCIGQEVRK